MDSNKPVKQFRLGPIVTAIFASTTDGRTYYDAVTSRLYKKSDIDIEWQRTSTLGRNDLPRAIETQRQAWLWMYERSDSTS